MVVIYTEGTKVTIKTIMKKDYFWPEGYFEELSKEVNGAEGVILHHNPPNLAFGERESYQVKAGNHQVELELDEFEVLDYTVVQDIQDATHWLAKKDFNIPSASVVIGKRYQLYEDEHDFYIIDEKGINSLIFLLHQGDYIRQEKEDSY